MRRSAAVLTALLSAWAAAGAGSSLVDARGNLIAVEAITAVSEDGASLSAIRVRQTAPGGKVTEEFVPGTIDDAADLSPQVLYDAASGRILVVWVRHDGRRMSLAGASRGESGEWSSVARLDPGEFEPSDLRADVDSTSRLHVVFKSVENKTTRLRHRAYDLGTLAPDGKTTDPFTTPGSRKGRRSARGGGEAPEGGTDEPGFVTGAASVAPAGPAPAERSSFTTFGVEGGCDVAVVWRVVGSRLEIASLTDGRWRRGNVDLGEDPLGVEAGALAAEIAKRFCRP